MLRVLKLQLGAEVHTLCKGSFSEVLADNPYIDKRFQVADSLSETVSQLKAESYDRVIDLQNNLRSRIITLRLGVRATHVNKLNVKKWILVNLKRNKMPNVHIVDRYLDACSDLSVSNDQKGLDYFFPADKGSIYSALKSKFQLSVRYTCIAIGAAHFTKRIPLQKLIEVCDANQGQVILLGGPGDTTLGNQIVKQSINTQVVNLAGEISLTESALVLSKAKVLVTPDTGLMHIGAALDVPMVTVWGNTVSKFGMYPYLDKERFDIVENNDLSCRPCSKIGHKQCPKGHFKCMNDIKSATIVDKLNAFIE